MHPFPILLPIAVTTTYRVWRFRREVVPKTAIISRPNTEAGSGTDSDLVSVKGGIGSPLLFSESVGDSGELTASDSARLLAKLKLSI
jgi:hypothetical protein